jgi:hypothetical protein
MAKKRVEMTGKKSAQKPVRTEKRKIMDSDSKMPKAREKSHGSSGIQSRKKVMAWVKWQSPVKSNISIFSSFCHFILCLVCC